MKYSLLLLSLIGCKANPEIVRPVELSSSSRLVADLGAGYQVYAVTDSTTGVVCYVYDIKAISCVQIKP